MDKFESGKVYKIDNIFDNPNRWAIWYCLDEHMYFLLNNEGYSFSESGHIQSINFWKDFKNWHEIEFDVGPYLDKIKRWKARAL